MEYPTANLVTDLYNEDYNRFFPPVAPIMGGRIFGEGLNG